MSNSMPVYQEYHEEKYLFLTLGVQLLVGTCYTVSWFYFTSKYDLDIVEFTRIMFALSGSPMDDITFTGSIVLMSMMSIGLTIGVFPLKAKIINLMQLFHCINLKRKSSDSTDSISTVCNPY